MEVLKLLEDFGFSDQESRVYLALLELGPSTVKPISDLAKIKRTSIYNFIDLMIAKGVVGKSTKNGRKLYFAEAPSRLVEIQKKRLANLEQGIEQLTRLASLAPGKPRISYLEGVEQVRNIMLEETRCKKEVLYIWAGRESMEAIGGTRFMNSVDRERIAKGIKVKAIRFREKDVPFASSSHGSKHLRELRYAPVGVNVSMSLGIYDTGKVGLISSQKERFGLLVESAELTQLLQTLFQYFWTKCETTQLGEG